ELSTEKRKYFETAELYYERAAQASPYSLAPLENREHLMIVQGRFEAALELQNQIVQMAPEYPPAYIEQGRILLHMGRAQEAIAAAQKAVDLDYYYLLGQDLKARAMEALGKKADALQVYKTIEGILQQFPSPENAERMKEIDARIQKLQGRP
ncbi:MAG TPA: tetratricopeptide repeat protein, partial [bacterium]|nr:tetratricopeptide repeat protein [bacterium]